MQAPATVLKKGSTMASSQPLSVLMFMTGRNCAPYVREAVQSVARQTHPNVHALFIDDCSDDDTADAAQAALSELLPGRFELVRNPERLGKACNASTHLRRAAREHDIVAVLDADDFLLDVTVLAQLAHAYRQGHDVVWTNYLTDHGRFGGNGPLDRNKSPRAQRWLTSHLFSFRASLLETVPEDYFQYPDGQWLDAACDLAIAYPILDQTRRYHYIPVHAYRYTESNPQSHHNQAAERQTLSSPKQRACAQIVLSKAPLPRLDLTESPTTSAAPRPVATPTVTAASPWETACAVHLAQQVPSLLQTVPAAELNTLDAMQLLAWQQHLREVSGRQVLCIGTGAHLEALSCLASQQDAVVTRLRASGTDSPLAPVQDDVAAPWAEYILADEPAYLPELAALPEGPAFDTVIVSANAWGGKRLPLVGLAAIAPLMHPTHFDLWMLGLSPDELSAAQALISEAMPDVDVACFASRSPCLHIRARLGAQSGESEAAA
jgi:hypothetical protein